MVNEEVEDDKKDKSPFGSVTEPIVNSRRIGRLERAPDFLSGKKPKTPLTP